MPDIETIIQGAVDTLTAVADGGIVDTQTGGCSTWAKTPGEKQSYWIVGHFRSDSKASGAGSTGVGRAFRQRIRRVTVDIWMPWSVALETATTFRDLVNDAEWQLLENLGLGVCAKITALPFVEFNRIEPYSSLNQNDLSRHCHHARIVFDVIEHRAVTAT